MESLYKKYVAYCQELQDIGSALSLMSWDQEVMMPTGGAAFRSRQIATLAGIKHEKQTSNEFFDILQELSVDGKDLNWEQKKNVELSLKSINKAKKFPKSFIQEFSQLRSEAFQSWLKSREENDFTVFSPDLERLVEKAREQTEILGYPEQRYDALIDNYDPGTTTKKPEEVFTQVKEQLVPFYQSLLEAESPDNSFMFNHFEDAKQWDFGVELLKQMGYDFNHGRQDKAPHPFSISFSNEDSRVTTRIDEENFTDMTWSTIHEGGHALYEMGLLKENYGLPSGTSTSLSIHESQSRLWENNVGRSLAYWKANYSRLQALFPDNLGSVSLNDFYRGMNKVQPSLIRVDADELSYHLHILVRFEMEKALLDREIEVREAADAWVEKYRKYLAIDVPDDKSGVLQDIHWSHGSFGYFPTYSLGSFYAAQFFNQASKNIPGLEDQIAKGEMDQLLQWLKEGIHKHGMLYNSEELCKRVTGEGLNFQYFMDYVGSKYREIYNV